MGAVVSIVSLFKGHRCDSAQREGGTWHKAKSTHLIFRPHYPLSPFWPLKLVLIVSKSRDPVIHFFPGKAPLWLPD